MLSVNKLEKVIELEEQLRAEYTDQLEARAAELKEAANKQAELQATVDKQQATIDRQLETITELSGKSKDTGRLEQLNRELTNRSEKLQDEVTELKRRVKALQKDLAEVRAENKTLTQYDPQRMKKNLDANKKKLAEKTRANEVLQKSLNKSRTENAELQSQVKNLEARLEELEGEEPKAEEEAAA